MAAADERRGGLQGDLERSLLRLRNGARMVAGVGRPPMAQTPKDTVWAADKVQLWRYRSDTRRVRTPLLFVHSLVTRSYVFDLTPGNSFVESMLARGHDVYLIDWGVPDELESHNTLQTYSDGYLPEIVEAVVDDSGSPDVNLFGYCFGGVLSLLYLAGNPDAPVRNLAVMATPIDMHRMGPMSTLLKGGRVDPSSLLDPTGNVPARTMLRSFQILTPTADVTQYVNLYQRLWNDDFVAAHQTMTTWARDHIPFPGAAFVQMSEVLNRQNLLATGKVPLGDRTVDLGDITVPFLNIVGEKDHIVPPEANEPLTKLVGSDDVEELRLPAGHVGLFVGRTAHGRNIPAMVEWLDRRSELVD
jgi:polyhydroxyalkanoate synthase subunit PhaC